MWRHAGCCVDGQTTAQIIPVMTLPALPPSDFDSQIVVGSARERVAITRRLLAKALEAEAEVRRVITRPQARLAGEPPEGNDGSSGCGESPAGASGE
jgi:hypothetical protein